MRNRPSWQGGYSLIELLTVLIIVGILATAGVLYLGSRPATGVRGILDELEGSLLDAQKQAVASGKDVTIATNGVWDPANPLVLIRGDASIGTATAPTGYTWAQVFTAAQGSWATLPSPANPIQQMQFSSLSLGFRLDSSNGVLSREHQDAMVATSVADFTAAVGTSQSITSAAPFSATAGFAGALPGASLLFNGAASTAMSVSGTNKRFNQTFWIPVVSVRSGLVVPGGPMGVIFVQANGGTVFKFYNPGTQSGDGQWRRI